MTKSILYDLGVAAGAISLWLTPWNASRAVGYSLSVLFSGRAYYTGICLLQKERKNDEKKAIAYEAETDFYDQLLGSNIEAELEVKALEVENRMLQRIIPLVQAKTALENRLKQVQPIHPELTEEDREQAAKSAIDSAFPKQNAQEINEEEIRKQFPETMDATSWKACLKALGGGASREEIVKDVLGGGSAAGAYFELLKNKFL